MLQPALVDYEPETTPISCRRRTKRPPPKPAEILEICHEALVLKHHHKDVAKKHNIGVASVSRYATKAKKNPNYMEELYSK